MLSFTLFGGNQVSKIDLSHRKKINFASTPYHYFCLTLEPNESYCIEQFASYTLFSLYSNNENELCLGQENYLKAGDSVQVEHQSITIKAIKGRVVLLIAGVEEAQSVTPRLHITRRQNQYTISKPWGHELWLNQEHPFYCLKEVMIKKGNRTSLQYHRFKEETNVLFSGDVKLIYKSNETVENDNVCATDLGEVMLSSLSVIHVTPLHLHRLEALTDVLLYEVSTPHLDDVIRVQDDRSRQNGRISSEHIGL